MVMSIAYIILQEMKRELPDPVQATTKFVQMTVTGGIALMKKIMRLALLFMAIN